MAPARSGRRFCAISREPWLIDIEQGVQLAREKGVRAVVSLGGGAVIDAGKAIAALVPAAGPLVDYLEVVGTGRQLEASPLPFVAIPTTAGTGAEVTKNAVINVPEQQRKVSLRDDRMLPDLNKSVRPAATRWPGSACAVDWRWRTPGWE